MTAKGRRRLQAALLIALIPGVVGIVAVNLPVTSGLERGGLDMLFALRGQRPQPTGVVVVAIDQESRDVWDVAPLDPWPRYLHGELVRGLRERGALATAFDVLFLGPSAEEFQDDMFVEGLIDAGNVILGATVEQINDPRFRSARQVEPLERFGEVAARVAEVNLPTDRDGVIRMTWPMHDERPSLALAAYEVATGDTSRREGAARLIDYYGPPRTISTISLYQALEADTYLPPDFFEGKIVFVGLSEIAAAGSEEKDAFLTPFRGGRGALTYGVEIHATIAANLLEDRRLEQLARWQEGLLLLLLPTVASLLFLYLRPVYGGLALIVLEILPWVSAYTLFTWQQLWIPVILPSVVQLPLGYGLSLLWYYLTTVKDRERIRTAFGHYLSPAMIGKIAESSENLDLGGEEIVATALFSDIAGFTSIAEGMSAEETATMLNEYFSEITSSIFENDGTLIKYIGDAVFAIWGAPIPIEKHALLACRTAIAMSRAQERMEGAAGNLVTRIGVHTGPMLVGNLGSEQRFDYTAIGDAVNLAARLEGLNKTWGTIVIASGESFEETDGSVVGRSLGRVRVVGKKLPVEIYELLAVDDEVEHLDHVALGLFQDALRLFEKRQFDEAERIWREVIERLGGSDGPSELYLAEIVRLRNKELPDDWDGVINISKK